jgi:endoglucanase
MSSLKSAVLFTLAIFCISSTASARTKFKPFETKDSSPKTWMETGVNQIENSSFSNSGKGWNFFLSGGNAAAAYGKNKVVISINSTGNVNYGVQFYYDGFRLYRGGKYTFTFTASSDLPKGCEVRLQMNGGDYHEYAGSVYTFTKDPRTYTINLDMEEDSDVAPRLAFNMGIFPDRDGGSPAVVTLSDISLILNNTIATKEEGNGGADIVRVNQIGYRPHDTKLAYVKVTEDNLTFTVNNAAGKDVLTGKLSTPVRDEKAAEYTAAADFSKLTEPGTYTVEVAGNKSYPFTIADNVYDKLITSSLRFFYLQRCGTAVDDPVFGHDACHMGNARIIGTNDYETITGGWHDAGDYGRYVVAGAKAVSDLLLAWDACKNTYTTYNIPEEVRYELDWMLKMQRPDGGVYHKLTCKKFPPYEMPQQEKEQLVLSPVSTTATGDFAADMALASIYYQSIDKEFAGTALTAAEKAWVFLDKNGPLPFINTTGVESGAYGDYFDNDERYFAAAALFAATGKTDYAEKAKTLRMESAAGSWKENYGWAQVEAYGDELVLRYADKINDKAFIDTVKKAVIARADEYVSVAQKSGFRVTVEDFIWGSNMVVLDNAHLLLLAYDITGKELYRTIAANQIDYILGCNPLTECYVTGNGSHSPQHPHHRPSIALNKPMPGMVAGGPDEHLDDAFAQNLLTDKPPLLCYIDNYQSFSTNEVTIYWNSPLVYCLAKLYYSGASKK